MGSYKLTKSLFYLYFAAIVWIILFKMQMPFANMGQIRSISLIPFAGSVKVNGQIYIPEIVENVLIFIPFGIFSGMSGQSKTWLRRLAPSFFTSLALEILQFILAAGVSDMTDLLANTQRKSECCFEHNYANRSVWYDFADRDADSCQQMKQQANCVP